MKKNIITVVRFVVFLLLMLVVGYLIGYAIGSNDETLNYPQLYGDLTHLLGDGAIYFMALSFILAASATVVTLINFNAIKKSDEEEYERIEKRLTIASALNEVGMIINLAGFGFMVSGGENNGDYIEFVLTFFFVLMGYYILNAVFTSRAIRKINPEKTASVLEINYRTQYLKTTDEAEKEQIGRAAFRSFRATSMTILVFWIVTVLLSMMVDIGVFPVLMLTALWLTQYLSFVTTHSVDK